ncbi:MAG: BrnA antitoxin family protein [Rubrivivax sp.]
MPIAKKRTPTSRGFSAADIAAAKRAAPSSSTGAAKVDWSKGIVTAGGGVATTIAAVRRTRGPGKKPAKEQVAIRLDPDVLVAFRSGGPGWQTRMNAALKEWLAAHPAKRKTRGPSAA